MTGELEVVQILSGNIMVTDELIGILLSWAALLSPYDPAPNPIIETKPHSFFVENACNDVECNVVGWYNDNGIVFLDENLPEDRDDLILHELVHYLQHLSGEFDSEDCNDSIERELEAYSVQAEYMVQNGRMAHPISHRVSCKK